MWVNNMNWNILRSPLLVPYCFFFRIFKHLCSFHHWPYGKWNKRPTGMNYWFRFISLCGRRKNDTVAYKWFSVLNINSQIKINDCMMSSRGFKTGSPHTELINATHSATRQLHSLHNSKTAAVIHNSASVNIEWQSHYQRMCTNHPVWTFTV